MPNDNQISNVSKVSTLDTSINRYSVRVVSIPQLEEYVDRITNTAIRLDTIKTSTPIEEIMFSAGIVQGLQRLLTMVKKGNK